MDLCATPAVELARLIRARELSAAELLDAVLARIDEANPVAAGLIPFADGSDLAASVRNPASFCGVVGLRTTPGLVPGDPFDLLGVVGPIARTAPDAALLLAGMCGTDPGLPLARPERPGDFLGLRPASLQGLRVAWSSVPAGLTPAGLPVGLQLVGRYGADRRLLELAAAITELTTRCLS